MKWEPVDYIVLLLVFFIISFMTLLQISKWDGSLSEHAQESLRTVLLTTLAIISVYVGSKIKGGDRLK